LVLLGDFVGLFLEAMLIVALAVSVGDIRSFAICVFVLLAVDVVRATVAWELDVEHQRAPDRQPEDREQL
jgi:hypothetical protein